MVEKPWNNKHGYQTKGDYIDYFYKDRAMTEVSDIYILWIRLIEETKKIVWH